VKLDPDKLRNRLAPVFQENFTRFGELGAAVSVWQHGESIIELHGGYRDNRKEHPWNEDTIVLVWSATKGIGSACLLHALQENGIEISRRVAEFWPEFAAAGKQDVTIAALMSHGAGLCALDLFADVLDYGAVISALEKQTPLWPPDTDHGYHARTFGFLIDELNRRITGSSIATYWRRHLAEPLGLDFWIGLPNELNHRVATTYPAKAGGTPEPAKFYRDLVTPGTLQQRAFTSPHGLKSVSAMNKPEIRAQPIVSFGGIGSAAALAQFYSMLASDGGNGGKRYFADATVGLMIAPRHQGIDRVFEVPTAFSAGFMVTGTGPNGAAVFGKSGNSFGHPGAGGSVAFADRKNGLGFAYVMNQMAQSVLPTTKALRLVATVYDSLGTCESQP
jgi:CubicO group peptidase (beta-lactamase class C family)